MKLHYCDHKTNNNTILVRELVKYSLCTRSHSHMYRKSGLLCFLEADRIPTHVASNSDSCVHEAPKCQGLNVCPDVKIDQTAFN